ncbi:hypothetical protein NDU88_003456 [Pleurodeles waltl]|uniref:Uncharacterized protein n=1 Tax=Pleurodeles waltl TaxID=8319 RepID=A0AAV7SF84_PLEWA|nr:hypothetical protein NDU88_003456 [Pleurodeles waltl]
MHRPPYAMLLPSEAAAVIGCGVRNMVPAVVTDLRAGVDSSLRPALRSGAVLWDGVSWGEGGLHWALQSSARPVSAEVVRQGRESCISITHVVRRGPPCSA